MRRIRRIDFALGNGRARLAYQSGFLLDGAAHHFGRHLRRARRSARRVELAVDSHGGSQDSVTAHTNEERRRMKFLRQLLAVFAVAAVIIGLGFVWKHSPLASLVADGRGNDQRVGITNVQVQPNTPPLPDVQNAGRSNRGNHGLSIANVSDLAQSMVVEGLIIGAIVVIDLRRRNHRRSQSGGWLRIPAQAGPATRRDHSH